MNKNKYVIAVYVDNKYGVLSRVTSMFTRRGFNIDTLAVGETEHPEFSRITLSFTGDNEKKTQLVAQLRKLYNVKKVEVIDGDRGIKRELLLIKVKNSLEIRADIKDAVDIFEARVVDYTISSMTIELTGDTSVVDAFIDNMKSFGIIEMCRTGIVAMDRGPESLLSQE